MELLAGEIMDPVYPALRHDEPLGSAADRMDAWEVSVLPVVESSGAGSFLVGILSEADLLASYARGRAYLRPDLKVADVMRPQPMSVTRDTPLWVLASILSRFDLRFLPVVQAGRLIGVVRRCDVLKALERRHRHWAARPAEERLIPAIPDIFTPVYERRAAAVLAETSPASATTVF